MYVLTTQDNQFVKLLYTVLDVQQAVPQVSIPHPFDDAVLETYGIFKLYQDSIPIPTEKQKLERFDPVFTNGRWQDNLQLVELNQQELADKETILTYNIKRERNNRLTQSDWTQLPDVVIDKTAWATYRQALRDITEQAGFPWQVTWPAPPV